MLYELGRRHWLHKLHNGSRWGNALISADYSSHHVKTRRNLSAIGLDQRLKSSYNANTVQLAGELGYALPVTKHTTFEPYAAVAWTRLHTKGFTESGGIAALTSNSQSSTMTFSTLGARTTIQLPLNDGKYLTLRAGAGWRHAFNTLRPEAQLAFIGGQSYSLQGTPLARDTAVIDLGAEANLSEKVNLSLGYTSQFGNHAGALRVRWAF